MTVKHLLELLASIPADQQHFEIEVWLPGSFVALSGEPFPDIANRYLIEGNLKPGSTLERT